MCSIEFDASLAEESGNSPFRFDGVIELKVSSFKFSLREELQTFLDVIELIERAQNGTRINGF